MPGALSVSGFHRIFMCTAGRDIFYGWGKKERVLWKYHAYARQVLKPCNPPPLQERQQLIACSKFTSGSSGQYGRGDLFGFYIWKAPICHDQRGAKDPGTSGPGFGGMRNFEHAHLTAMMRVLHRKKRSIWAQKNFWGKKTERKRSVGCFEPIRICLRRVFGGRRGRLFFVHPLISGSQG